MFEVVAGRYEGGHRHSFSALNSTWWCLIGTHAHGWRYYRVTMVGKASNTRLGAQCPLVGRLPNWTHIGLLYVIVRIKIRINLHPILVDCWLLWLNVIEERRCLTIICLVVERAMLQVWLFWWIVYLRGSWKLMIDSWMRSLTAQEVAIAATLCLELLVIFVLPQWPTVICRRLIHGMTFLMIIIALIHEGSSLITKIIMVRHLSINWLFINKLLLRRMLRLRNTSRGIQNLRSMRNGHRVLD